MATLQLACRRAARRRMTRRRAARWRTACPAAAAAAIATTAAMAAAVPFTPAQAADARAGITAHHLKVVDAALGDGVRIGERQSGLRAWSAEYAFDRVRFRIGAEYAYTRYTFAGLPTRARDLHHLHLPLRWRDRDDRWLAQARPVIATSSNVFKRFPDRGSGDDVDLHFRLQLQHRPAAGIGWRAALVRDAVFGTVRVYPAAALLWQASRVQAELGFPAARIDWQVGERLAVGAAVFPAGGSWHVVSDERGGAAFDFRARAWRGALTAGWQPLPRWRLNVQAGMVFHRRYRFEDDTGARIDRAAAAAGYGQIELRHAFR